MSRWQLNEMKTEIVIFDPKGSYDALRTDLDLLFLF